jgi:preprotein translocase subunit SecG
MNGFVIVLYTLVIVISLLLIALILVQQPKSGGFGSTFGGLGESVFGAHAIGHMTKLTVIFTTIFFVLTLTLAIVLSHLPEKESVLSSTSFGVQVEKAIVEAEQAERPVQPAEAAEAK